MRFQLNRHLLEVARRGWTKSLRAWAAFCSWNSSHRPHGSSNAATRLHGCLLMPNSSATFAMSAICFAPALTLQFANAQAASAPRMVRSLSLACPLARLSLPR
jgi:hypothetical protein